MHEGSNACQVARPALPPNASATSSDCRQQPNRWNDLPLKILRFSVATVVLIVAVAALPGCGSGGPPILPTGVAPAPANKGAHHGRVLHLSKTTVKSGEIIFRTIDGWNPRTDLSGVNMTLEHFESGTWQTIYYLWLDSPKDTPVGTNEAISAVGFSGAGWSSRQIRIPDVPPGTYRVRQDLSVGSDTSTQITLYAMIHVIP